RRALREFALVTQSGPSSTPINTKNTHEVDDHEQAIVSPPSEANYGVRCTSDRSRARTAAIGNSLLWTQITFQYSPLPDRIARPASVVMLSRRQASSLSASGIRMASIAVAGVHSQRKTVAAQSSA